MWLLLLEQHDRSCAVTYRRSLPSPSWLHGCAHGEATRRGLLHARHGLSHMRRGSTRHELLHARPSLSPRGPVVLASCAFTWASDVVHHTLSNRHPTWSVFSLCGPLHAAMLPVKRRPAATRRPRSCGRDQCSFKAEWQYAGQSLASSGRRPWQVPFALLRSEWLLLARGNLHYSVCKISCLMRNGSLLGQRPRDGSQQPTVVQRNLWLSSAWPALGQHTTNACPVRDEDLSNTWSVTHAAAMLLTCLATRTDASARHNNRHA